MTFSIIEIRSSFYLRTVPTLVFAAKLLIMPKFLVDTFEG